MDKSARKKLLRELQDEEEKKIALSKQRYLHEDIRWWGIGSKVLQLVYRPSFEPSLVWEIRRQEDTYLLFESTVSPTNPYILEPGYNQIEFASDELKQLVDSLKKIRVTIGTPVSNMVTVDGTSYEVCLYEIQKFLRIQWHSEPHQDWKEIALIVTEAIEKFKLVSKKQE